MTDRAPWAFIAHRDGYWAGVATADLPKTELRKFLGDFAAKGFAIATVFDRAEYTTFLSGLKTWRHRSEA